MHSAADDPNPIGLRAVEDILLQTPCVLAARVVETHDEIGGRRVSAYVVPDMSKWHAMEASPAADPNASVVQRWNKLYELTYSSGPSVPSFVGWNSSYDRQPIAEFEMHEWLQSTVHRVQALRPHKILEIGCGVGLLLQKLAPRCAAYTGTDFSASALQRLRAWMTGQHELAHVELDQRAATDIGQLRSGPFDTIVLNSVVQYFPDIGYLMATLDGALRLLEPGGRIFIGDVRHFGLLETFHSAVQLCRAPVGLAIDELRRRIVCAIAQEAELTIDPDFFRTLPERMPRITSVQIQLRRGVAENELTRYRYDVVLYTDVRPSARRFEQALTWADVAGSQSALHEVLTAGRGSSILLADVPNSRLARDAAARTLIASSPREQTVDSLRQRLNDLHPGGLDPEWAWFTGESIGYEVDIDWSQHAGPHHFDLHLTNPLRGASGHPHRRSGSKVMHGDTEYANAPGEGALRQSIIRVLREQVSRRLPPGMVPTTWAILRDLPQ